MSTSFTSSLRIYRMYAYAEVGLVYKLVLIKIKFAVSNKVIIMRINDLSLTGFNQYVTPKMIDGYSYTCELNQCHTCGCI